MDGEQQAQALTGLLSRGEGFIICAYLVPGDIASLTCATSSLGQDRMDIWRAYFVFHWGHLHGASYGTEVRLMRSWVDDAWPAPWPLAVGFCGARSILDHLFWFLPVLRCLLRIDRPRCAPPPPVPAPLTWQVVCRVQNRPQGAARMAHCFLCDVLEVAPLDPAPQHFRQRWARPCPDCPMLAHRACLERELGTAPRGEGPKRSDLGKGPGSRLPMVRCRSCGQSYTIAQRFPETLWELMAATKEEWRWALRRYVVMILFYAWLHALAEHYSLLEGVCKEIHVLMVMAACMLSISTSQRFHRAVQVVWHTPNRWLYFKIFGLGAVLTYLASLRTFEPSDWVKTARRLPWLSFFYEVHSLLHGSTVGTLMLSMISWLYVVTVTGVIFCFWKTSVRVRTVADAGWQGGLQTKSIKFHSACGLCQLGLCLDNTDM